MTQKFTKYISYTIHPFPCHIIYINVQTIASVATLGLMSPEAATDGVTPIFS